MKGDDGSDIDNAASATSILGGVFLPVCVAIALCRLRRVDCLPLISDLCLVAALRSRPVTDYLDAAVREVDPVLALGVVVLPVLLVGEHSAGVLGIVDSELVLKQQFIQQNSHTRISQNIFAWMDIFHGVKRVYA